MKRIYGRKPILEALKSDAGVSQIYLLYNQHSRIINDIKKLAKKKGVRVSQISSSKFKTLAPKENTQGIVAEISDKQLYSLNQILNIASKKPAPLLLLIDSVQDPHNLGAIFRTAEAAGVDGIIMSIRNTAPINETVSKTSAGAISHLKICRESNLVDVIKILKKENYWIVGSKLGDNKNYTEIDFSGPIALVVGNEEKGIRRLIAENCDFLAEIPMKGKIQSLNVSVATGILLFEIIRQREI